MSHEAYHAISAFYDRVNADIDYDAWADYIEENICRHLPARPELVLDLACGTGSMTLTLARRGYDMIGVDGSAEMLNIAMDRARAAQHPEILFLLQDMREFELYGTVDVTVSCLDCINHLTTPSDLRKCLSLVHNYLIPDGLFIFDINGRRKFESIYAENTYTIESEGSLCIWQNSYNPKTHLCDFYITLFEECEDGRYARADDWQQERMYTLTSLKRMLTAEGFEFIGAYSDYSFTKASNNDERIYIAARCKKDGNK